ncbi:MAG: rhomboid family intramembrane serine protease [Planctomycetes bacterium]|nr:rhomboid family intramembrane serine protease [Planctomycetota bacterium]
MGVVKATHVLCVVYFLGFLVQVIGQGATWHLAVVQALGVHDAAGVLARPWTLVTHLVLHRHPLEAVLAAGILLLAGARVERRLGAARFLAVYLTAGALVALAHVGLVEAGIAPGRVLTGSLGASTGLLTAFLFLMPERRVGSVPYPVCYVVVAAVLVALVGLIGFYDERALRERAEKARSWAEGGEAYRPEERVDLLWHASAERRTRPNHLVHLLGFALGGVALGSTLAAGRYRQRARMLREIRGLQEEVDARARVDELLDKISRHGMSSLSRNERKFLRYASRFYRGVPGSQASSSP